MGWKDWPGWLKGLIIGLVIGIVLFIINIFLLGLIGMFILSPLFSIYTYFTGNYNLIGSLFGCSGEECWGPMILVGGLAMLFISSGLGLFIGLFGKLKGFVITLLIVVLLPTIILVPLGILDYNKNMDKTYDNIEKFKGDLQELDSELISISKQSVQSEIIIKAPSNIITIDETTEKTLIEWREPFDKKYLGNREEIIEDGILINKIDDGIMFSKDFSDKFNLIFNEESREDPETESIVRMNIVEKREQIYGCVKLTNGGLDSDGKIRIEFELVAKTGAC